MSLAQRQTGSQLPTECVFFPLFFNYRLDLIKSFCDISQWLVITSIKNMIPEQQSGDSFFFFVFPERKYVSSIYWHHIIFYNDVS